MANWFLRRVPIPFNGEKLFSSTNILRIFGHSHEKVWFCVISNDIQKSTQNGP